MKNKFFGFSFLCLISVLPSLAFTWNLPTHVIIAEIAYQNLKSDVKEKTDELAQSIFNDLSASQQEKLNKEYSNVSTFAKLALEPDQWRNLTLSELFLNFHATLPPIFGQYSDAITAHWHYIDTPFPNSKICKPINPTNVVWALEKISMNLPAIKNTYTQNKDFHENNTKGLFLILAAHFIGDIHQPLHAMTNVSKDCKGDAGGNAFCLHKTSKGKCKRNLHGFWDSAAEYTKNKSKVSSLVKTIQIEFPMSDYMERLNFHPEGWSQEAYKYAEFIYSIKENEKPDAAYYKQTQQISKLQIALAGYRLAYFLNNNL